MTGGGRLENGHHHPYVQAAIEGEVARLASAREGERNRTLFKSTASLAGLGLREGEILQHLKPAAEAIGLKGKELYATVKSGVKAGMNKPREISCRIREMSGADRLGTPTVAAHAHLRSCNGVDTPAFVVVAMKGRWQRRMKSAVMFIAGTGGQFGSR